MILAANWAGNSCRFRFNLGLSPGSKWMARRVRGEIRIYQSGPLLFFRMSHLDEGEEEWFKRAVAVVEETVRSLLEEVR